jgi:hypothetical protein
MSATAEVDTGYRRPALVLLERHFGHVLGAPAADAVAVR